MRVLVVGASGQLGHALSTAFSTAHDVVEAAYRHAVPGQLTVDLGNSESILAALTDVKPELVALAAAKTNVDDCEVNPDECFWVNAIGPRVVAEHARQSGAFVVYYSTDYVFDGSASSYVETDPVSPLNTYGRSKAEGEAAVRDILRDRHLVLRTSWVYGPDRQRRNFALRLVDGLSRAGAPIRIASDQWGSPTYTEDLAVVTRALVERGHHGTFHATGPELIDRAGLAMKVCERFGLDPGWIAPTPTDLLAQRTQRPLRVHLDCRKLRFTCAGEFRGIDAGLASLQMWHSAQA